MTKKALALGLATLALGGATALAAPGDLDNSFDGDGRTTLDFGGTDALRDVLVQPDGKIVLVGDGRATVDAVVARLNRDGTLDLSFDGDGTREYLFGGTDVGNALALQADGKIVFAGESLLNNEWSGMLARLNPDGSTDGSFGDAGQVVLTDETGLRTGGDVLIQPDGKIIVVGIAPGNNFGAARFNADGTLDSAFAGDGTAEIEFNPDAISSAQAVALAANGKIVVAGTGGSGGDAGVARLNADGSLDTSFDGDGRLELFDADGTAQAVLVQPDQKIVLALDSAGMSAARLNPDGSRDTSFDDDGVVDAPVRVFGAALQANGKVVLAGRRDSEEVAALVRLQPGGSLDTTFSGDGLQLLEPGFRSALGMALQPTGDIVVAGQTRIAPFGPGDAFVARLQGDPLGAGGGPPGGGTKGGPGAGGLTSVPRCAGRRATIVGTPGKNRLRGSRRSDVIVALGGNDSVTGGRGNDVICAGDGNDSINGDSGNDRVYGQNGKDRLKGGSGNDALDGGSSTDLLVGQGGRDRLSGGPGRDRCSGGPGRDGAKCERRTGI